MKELVIGTRGSELARTQSAWVKQQLRDAHGTALEVRERIYSTKGDRILDRPLPEVGGKGLFTAEIEAALLAGEVDLAVHSLKDLPLEQPQGLMLGATPMREDPREVLVSSCGRTWQTLVAGDIVGTSSPRRRAQLEAATPGIVVVDLRGNVPTRLRKVAAGEPPSAILAAAGLTRLALLAPDHQLLDDDLLVSAPGQGALGLQVRAGDERVLDLIRVLHHEPSEREVTAEREVLRLIGGGCSAPLGARARTAPTGELELRVFFEPEPGCPLSSSAAGVDPLVVASEALSMLDLS